MSQVVSTQLIQLAMTLLVMIVVVIAGVGLKALNTFMDVKIGAAKWDDLKGRANITVAWLAQAPAAENWENPQKKQYALVDLLQYAEKAGIQVLENAAQIAVGKIGLQVSHEDIDKIVEEAYVGIKNQIAPLYSEDMVAGPVTSLAGSVTLPAGL